MGKNIAELVVKMKSETSLSVETMGDSTDQVFMAAIAVAHTVADASNGNRKKAEVVMTIAKAIIDERFESIWKREYGTHLPPRLLIPPPRQKSRTTLPLHSPPTWTA